MILKKIIQPTGWIILLFLIFSCDKINKPYIEEGNHCGNDSLIPIRKILLEDYTGHMCGNCPRAHEEMEKLIDYYCEHIVPMVVHVGYFAEPVGTKYSADYRTETGDELDAYFNISAELPKGMVNRTSFDGSVIVPHTKWTSAIEELLKTPPEIDISIINNYDTATRYLQVNINTKFLKDMERKLNLAVYLLEDSIVSMQKDYDKEPPDIPNYVHRHMLRDAINKTWGDEILNGAVSSSDIIEKNYTFTLDSAYKDTHCSVVAYIFDPDTKQVIQAEDQHIIYKK